MLDLKDCLGSAFQTVGPATEKVRRPNVEAAVRTAESRSTSQTIMIGWRHCHQLKQTAVGRSERVVTRWTRFPARRCPADRSMQLSSSVHHRHRPWMARPVRVSVPLEEDELRKRGYFVGNLLGEGSYAKVKCGILVGTSGNKLTTELFPPQLSSSPYLN